MKTAWDHLFDEEAEEPLNEEASEPSSVGTAVVRLKSWLRSPEGERVLAKARTEARADVARLQALSRVMPEYMKMRVGGPFGTRR